MNPSTHALADKLWQVTATVQAVVQQVKTAALVTARGERLRVADDTPGLAWDEIEVGKSVVVTLQGTVVPKVMSAHGRLTVGKNA